MPHLLDSYLNEPVNFFLQNFELLQLSFTSACILRYLYNIVTGDGTITYSMCYYNYSMCYNNTFVIQVFFTDIFGVTEFFSWPPCPVTAMWPSANLCVLWPSWAAESAGGSPLLSNVWLVHHTPALILFLNLKFCNSNVTDYFFCDASPILKICSDTWLIEQLVNVCAVLTFVVTLMCVVLSDIYIIKTLLRFPSALQRKRGFSTCSSHMSVVSITYRSCIFICIKPSTKESVAINKGVTVLMTSIAPMLNPFIYTLRNTQVRQAFSNSFKRIALISKQ